MSPKVSGSGKAKVARAAKQQCDDSSPPEENSLLARKRAMDREAQRNFRAKTKNYIAHLEQTIKACEADSESQRVAQLLAENERLYDTLRRMRRILNDIFTAIQPELLRQNLSTICEEESRGVIEAAGQQHDSKNAAKPTKPPRQPSAQSESAESPSSLNAASEQSMLVTMPDVGSKDLLDTFFGNIHSTGLAHQDNPAGPTLEVDQASQEQAPEQQQYETRQPPFDQQGTGGQSTYNYRLALPRNPSTFCFWAHANIIYSQIFTITPTQAFAVTESDRNLLFKAIKCGWQSLELECNHNIVLRILKCYDELVMGAFEPIDRLAIAYKNYVLIQFFLKRDFNHMIRVPEWQRPSSFTAIAGKYPLLVDFFPWPGLREKIISGKFLMDQSFFGRCFLSNFRFAWPFTLEDTYQYCAASDLYLPTQLFEQYYQDLRCWTMGESFFGQFPQLVGDIGIYSD